MSSAPNNIFLCGFMGSGKSTLGKQLAQSLNYHFIELDHLIEEQCGKSITNIFNEEGETGFREKEKKALESALGSLSPMVVALGGGTPCFFDNLEKIKKKGLLVYIELTAEELWQRIRQQNIARPLLQNLEGKAQLDFISTKLEERNRFYRQAHLCVDGMELDAERLLNTIRGRSVK